MTAVDWMGGTTADSDADEARWLQWRPPAAQRAHPLNCTCREHWLDNWDPAEERM